MKFGARKGLAESPLTIRCGLDRICRKKARRTGVRGETYAYWYLRRHGYTLVARNYTLPGFKGEIDMVGYDGRPGFRRGKDAFRSSAGSRSHCPKKPSIGKSAATLPAWPGSSCEFAASDSSHRFDILAIESQEDAAEVRLHKDASAAWYVIHGHVSCRNLARASDGRAFAPMLA